MNIFASRRVSGFGFLQLAIVASFGGVPAFAAEWKVGVAAVSITPEEPIHLFGYPSRVTPFESVAGDIYAKALAIEDAEGNRGVIVTTDLVGLQDAFSGAIAKRIEERTGLTRRQLLLNASHNHTGPLVSLEPITHGNLGHGDMTAEEAARTVAYSRRLQDQIVELVVAAIADLQPAELSWGVSRVGFVMNRRSGEAGAIHMAPNPGGAIDATVPVLKATTPDGTLRCLLFGCACHNTTLTPDHNVISGDYAGDAQAALQQRYPGVQAMFLSGCGADANPEPRGGLDQSKSRGEELAAAVCKVVEGQGTGSASSLAGPLRMAYEVVELPLMKLTPADLAKYAERGGVQAMMAEQMSRVFAGGGKLKERYAAPVAVWRFGDGLTLVALPGEGVADYAQLIGRRLRSRNVWVSSYNNDCFGYLPTAQVVREGGHEAIGVTVWLWGNHLAENVGFFSEEVEETIINAVARLADNLERK